MQEPCRPGNGLNDSSGVRGDRDVAPKLPDRGHFNVTIERPILVEYFSGGRLMTIRSKRSVPLLLLGISLSAAPATAQVFTPTYMAPGSSSDVGVYLSDGPGDFAIEGIWRRAGGAWDLGLRGGLADTRDLGILLGAELRNPLSTGAPLDIAVTGHAQGLIIPDFDSGVGFLVGLSLGYTFASPEISFTPYLHPRAGIVAGFGDDDLDLELLADFGFDVRINQSLEFRFGLSFEDMGADWGVGLAWR